MKSKWKANNLCTVIDIKYHLHLKYKVSLYRDVNIDS